MTSPSAAAAPPPGGSGTPELPVSALVAATDWAATSLGPREHWPPALATAAGICLESRFPILLWWGEDLVMLYNDAYRLILGDKHPAAMGMRGRDCWPEIWDVIGPMLEGVLRRGDATWSEDQLLLLNRRGFAEECYFTFSYSPIRDGGAIGGVFTAVTETTERVTRERRLALIRSLGGGARSTSSAVEAATAILEGAVADIPFAVLELEACGVPMATAGVDPAAVHGAAHELLGDVAEPDAGRVVDAASVVRVPVTRAWDTPVTCAFVLPLECGSGGRLGTLVLGLSPALPLDDEYLDFLRVVGARIDAAIADARHLEAERRRADELAALDAAKTTFFTNVSHELRTPLTLLLGPLTDVVGSEALPAAERAPLETAVRNGRRLHRLVNTLLDVMRLDAGRLEPRFERVDLGELTASIASMFEGAYARAGVELRTAVDGARAEAWVDPELAERIVANLLSNALKFTQRGSVEIGLEVLDGEARLTVRDTGIGIAEADLPRLFERFVRLDDAGARSHEGSGIGLALTAELVRLHGGTIGADSRLGEGTTLTVTLPLGHAGLAPARLGGRAAGAPPGSAASSVLEDVEGWLGDDEDERPGDRPSERTASRVPELDGAHILIADDNRDMRRYVASLLLGADVTTVGDGAAALAVLDREPVDLLIADVMMAGIDGFELVRRVRARPGLATMPILILSARAGEEASIDGLQAGADDYLVKPFVASELVGRVAARLAATRARRHAEAQLREAEERWRVLTEDSPALVGLLDPAGGVISTSRAWRTYLGGEPAGGALAAGWVDWIHPDDLATLRAAWARGAETRLPIEAERIRIRRHDGEYRFFDSLLSPVMDEAGGIRMWIAVTHDVHEQTVAQAAVAAVHRQLERQVMLLDGVIAASPVGIGVWDAQLRCLTVNERLAQMNELPVEAHLGRRPDESLPDRWPLFEPHFREALAGRQVLDVELAFEHPVSGAWGAVLASFYPLRAADGTVDGVALACIDVTEARRRERQLEAALGARDEFLGLVSHELRTPLTTILGGARVLAERHDRLGEDERRELLTDLSAEAERLNRIVENLLTLSRLSVGADPELEPILADRVLARLVATEARAMRDRSLRLARPTEGVLVTAHAGYVEQIVGNLVSNADKYSEPGRPIDVSVARRDGEVVISVADRGVGIEADEAQRLFDPFYRSPRTAAKAGIGIGLTVCRRLAEAQGGRLWVEPRPGGGAVFSLALPAATVEE